MPIVNGQGVQGYNLGTEPVINSAVEGRQSSPRHLSRLKPEDLTPRPFVLVIGQLPFSKPTL